MANCPERTEPMARVANAMGAVAFGAVCVFARAVIAAPSPADLTPPAVDLAFGRDVLKQLVEINSTHALGSTVAAKAMAARFLASGFAPADVRVLIPDGRPDKGNVVVRLRGTGRGKPILYIGHLDVVEAKREDWTYDPFILTEIDGWLYGRGTIDMKGQDTALVTSLVRMKREGFKPKRDVIVALTADEEAGGDFSGIDWLLKSHRDLIDADLVMNPDGGGGEAGMQRGRKLYVSVQTSEKVFVTYQMEATDKGGHSSMPTPDNPIYRLSRALNKISDHEFPTDLTVTTRGYFARRADLETGQTQADMRAVGAGTESADAIKRLSAQVETNVMLRTTCVATQFSGGHGESALPQRARATIQCRVIPGEPVADIQAALVGAIDDPKVALTVFTPETLSPESPLSPTVVGAVEAVAKAMWPEVIVLPIMSPGASDSAFTRQAGMASYGVDGMFDDIDDSRAHGRDERIGVEAFGEELEFTYRLMKRLAG